MNYECPLGLSWEHCDTCHNSIGKVCAYDLTRLERRHLEDNLRWEMEALKDKERLNVSRCRQAPRESFQALENN